MISEQTIVGTYRAEAPCATITLIVNRDHSFVQSVRTNSGEANQLSGKWSVDKAHKTVDFEPSLDFIDDDRGRRIRGSIFVPELMPRGLTMGPIIVKCPDSPHQIDYVK